jgi:two-component system LytT family response regulator
MKTYITKYGFFEKELNSNVLVLFIELKMANTFISDDGQNCTDSLNIDLAKYFNTTQIIADKNFIGDSVASIDTSFNIQNLLHYMNQPLPQQKIAFPQTEGYEFVAAENILYCNAEGAYTNIHLTCNKKFLISRSLGNVEEMLPVNAFQRIHHSTIVNLQHVTNFIRSDGGYVIVNNGVKLMVSKARKDKLLERLGLKKD